MIITSPKNSLLQEIRRALLSGRPTAHGLLIAEGPHLLREVLRSRWAVEHILVSGPALERFAEILAESGAAVTQISERALQSASSTGHGQGIISLVRPPVWQRQDFIVECRTMLIILDSIQDPGNAGTIVRSGEAFGATGVALTAGSARVSNAKFLRASSGSLFRLPFLENLTPSDIRQLSFENRLALYGLSGRGGTPIAAIDFTRPCALVVGNEGAGVSQELLQSAIHVHIPVRQVESLNAAVACSIVLFEASRQRSSP